MIFFRISDVINPLALQIISTGITLLRKTQEGPPENVLPGPEFAEIDKFSSNETRIS